VSQDADSRRAATSKLQGVYSTVTEAGCNATGGRRNWSGFELGLNIGWLFGKGSVPRR
jgi:hypothetical protein